MTKYTTLTLLDLDATTTSTTLPMTKISELDTKDEGRAFEEARYNLATRVMSNGVEVIVAGDKSTLPGAPDIKRVLPSSIYKPVTLKPSTLTDHMMVLSQDASNNFQSLYPNQFVTKTCLTTFTYLTTYLEGGTTTVSSHEQVVSNVATEERNTGGKILPTPTVGVTLTQYPNLSVGTFHTTYTYLNTILDGEQPLVVSSKHTVTNTVTAPNDYLSLLQPSEIILKDTNTYFNTVSLEKTLYEGKKSKVISTNEVLTQVVITESVPPKATSVMTSYIALDYDSNNPNYTTTDVVKTYFVTYTYFNTIVENGNTIIKTNISTSSDVVTEKLFLNPKRTTVTGQSKKQKIDLLDENLKILATKTYHTTYTYFTTLLQENQTNKPTIIKSSSKIIENIVTETLDLNLFDKNYIQDLKNDLNNVETVTKLATLNDGQQLEVTAIYQEKIQPTKVLPIEKTKMPESLTQIKEIEPSTSTSPNVIVGSTIIFLDDETESVSKTPSLSTTINSLNSILSKEIVKQTSSKTKKSKTKSKIVPSKTSEVASTTKDNRKKQATKISKQPSDLLSLGSININHLQALKPVLNAMAGLIQTNLKSNRRNDSFTTTTTTSKPTGLQQPIYIPVGGLADDIEVAESQNIATFHLQETVDWNGKKTQKPVQESQLLNNGIPISPGEIITTNSDVIVGKPGRILPRIPSIPLQDVKNNNGIGMKPPPPPPPVKPSKPNKRTHEYKHIPVLRDGTKSGLDYVGPPPPLVQNIKIEPSVVNSPLVLPEIIERSTGQPLLVNIQPSQVAFVNIPHNRTTALIYGGANEQHRNGQYFDDPSPYPQPEFSGIDFSGNNRMPQIVNSIIRVGTELQPVLAKPDDVSYKINPTKSSYSEKNNHEINVNVPPISFGMVQQGSEFNAHIINHGIQFNSPPISYDVIKTQKFDDTIDLKPPNKPAKLPSVPKRTFVRPNVEISEFMTPPPPPTRPSYKQRPKNPIPIPLIPDPQSDLDDDDGDLISEDGEVIQESNARPLRPGQVPYEILRIQTTTSPTTSSTTRTTSTTTKKTISNVTSHYPRPIVSNPRPFLKPEEPIIIDDPNDSNQYVSFITSLNPPDLSQTSGFIDTVNIENYEIITENLDFAQEFGRKTTAKPQQVLHSTTQSTTVPPNRPKVTSLPIDTKLEKDTSNSQTEKPFKIIEIVRPATIQIPSDNIQINDLEAHASTSNPYEPPSRSDNLSSLNDVPKPTENIVPPPQVETIPPVPLEQIVPPPMPTEKMSQFPANIVPPRIPEVVGMSPPPITSTTTTSTTTPKPRRRRPSRRPIGFHRPTSTTTSTTIKPSTRRIQFRKPLPFRPPLDFTSTTSTTTIIPTPTIKTVPLMEVIIGTPNPIPKETQKETTTERTLTTKKDIILSHIHHSGNEVKIIESSSTSTPVPTKYVTHTKTSTVTITKTTVVKMPGEPPSTFTLLVTKTEKSTIIDTVTQIQTLVKPTSVIQTVTTTISSSIYPSTTSKPSTTTEDSKETLEDEESKQNDSIFVVMTHNNNKGSVIKVPSVPNTTYETQERDEEFNNEVNNILLGGILSTANRPTLEVPKLNDKCEPECKPSRNELCQKMDGVMRCICRPGFARMFPDRPCIPTYTYNVKVDLNRKGKEKLLFNQNLTNENTTDYRQFNSMVQEGLDRMVMQSDLRDIYHGIKINTFNSSPTGIITKFHLQLSDNIDEKRLEDIFRKYLRNNNFSLGGTELYATKEMLEKLQIDDFDECINQKYHDCSENAQCFNLKGTYTCSCKEGFTDLSENILYPGRLCSAEMIGCERCNYHGTCYTRENDQILCECFQWYTGEFCYINLKVLLIALVTLGAILFILLVICVVFTCCRKKPRQKVTTMSFLPQRVAGSTLDRRAMIQDTSSEDSRSEEAVLPYIPKPAQVKTKGVLKKPTAPQPTVELEESTIFPEQKDRSLTVMIPRAKYHPAPQPPASINYTSFDTRKPSLPIISNEAKLLSYLDAGPSPSKTNADKRKYSTQTESYIEENKRKTSGALISAGFEVSATVNMGTIGTCCGTEADRSENATLIQKISAADLLSNTSGTTNRSHFNTIRQSLMGGNDDDDDDPMSNWLDITPRIKTVSEARSFDETTIPPPIVVKSYRNDYGSKRSGSQHQNDEANTMAERDLGSTFLLPHTHLYKPDRGSDISGFESL